MDAATPPPRKRGRPPRAPDAPSDTREALLRAGLVALTEKGFSATGIDEVLSTVSVPKGSFYHYFKSKEAFGAELIDRYAAHFAARLDRHFADDTLTPLARLEAFTRSAEASMARHDFRRGCLVGNLGQEMGALPEPFRQRLAGVFADWQVRTASCLARAQAAGEIDPDRDPDQLAAFFWIGWEGAVLRAKLERTAAPLRTFADGFFALVRG